MKSKNFGFLLNKANLNNSRLLSIHDKISASLVTVAYEQTPIGLAASLFCATVVLVAVQDSVNKTVLMVWYGAFLVITLLRSMLASAYKAKADNTTNTPLWRNLFVAGAFFGGLSWGVTGWLLFPYDNINQQVLIILVLAGMTAGAVPVLAGILEAALAFIITASIPLIVNLLYHRIYIPIDTMFIVYLLALIGLARKMHATIRSALSLQFENSTLLANLSEAKHQLEIINKKLEQVATHDPLTNVANRNLFSGYFAEGIKRAKNGKKILALLYMDIDGFKNINDCYGHHIGDQLLLVLVDRLDQFFDTANNVARLGGDEFTVMLENVVDPNEVAKIAGRVCNVISQPVTINQIEIKVSTSIGIAIYPIDGDSAETLLTVADKAMYYVKERGGNDFRFNVTLIAD